MIKKWRFLNHQQLKNSWPEELIETFPPFGCHEAPPVQEAAQGGQADGDGLPSHVLADLPRLCLCQAGRQDEKAPRRQGGGAGQSEQGQDDGGGREKKGFKGERVGSICF